MWRHPKTPIKITQASRERMAAAAAAATFGALRQGVRTATSPLFCAQCARTTSRADLNGLSRGGGRPRRGGGGRRGAEGGRRVRPRRAARAALRDAFPNWTHARDQAAPLAFVVREAVDAGLGVEAASYGEAASALANGCPRERVVFDSPAKTVDELRWALDAGIAVNADSLDELARIDAVLAERSAPSASLLGLRVNACVDGKGEHAIFAVSENDSKFGHPLSSDAMRTAVVDAFGAYPWLRALHTHVGSAGTSLDMLAQGARRSPASPMRSAKRAGGASRRSAWRRPRLVDGVGRDVAHLCRARRVPARGSAVAVHRDRAVFTGLGRLAETTWIVSQVEYVKAFDGSPTRIATLQVGADLLMRQCYRPGSPLIASPRTTPTPNRSRAAAAHRRAPPRRPSASRATTRRRAVAAARRRRLRRLPRHGSQLARAVEPPARLCARLLVHARRGAPSSSYCRSRPAARTPPQFGLDFK